MTRMTVEITVKVYGASDQNHSVFCAEIVKMHAILNIYMITSEEMYSYRNLNVSMQPNLNI